LRLDGRSQQQHPFHRVLGGSVPGRAEVARRARNDVRSAQAARAAPVVSDLALADNL